MTKSGTLHSSSHFDFDTIIVGAGITGAACGYQITRLTNRRTLIIEQYSTAKANVLGSSHGASRIFRIQQDRDASMPMILDAYREWRELEHLSQQRLLVSNGLVWIGDNEATLKRAAIMRQAGCEHDVWTLEELEKKYPLFQYTPLGEDYSALWDPVSGTIRADVALAAMLEQFRRHGGMLKEREKVVRINPLGDASGGVIVRTDKALYTAKNVVLALGGWSTSGQLLPEPLPVRCIPLVVAIQFWNVTPGYEKYLPDLSQSNSVIPDPHVSPCLKVSKRQQVLGEVAYLPPGFDYPDKGKIYIDRGVPLPDMTTREDWITPPTWLAELSQEHVSRYLPGFDASNGPADEKTCIFAMTEDGSNFVIGRHPKWPSVLLAGPVGSTGYMFAPAVGRVMAALAHKGEFTDYDISHCAVKTETKSKI